MKEFFLKFKILLILSFIFLAAIIFSFVKILYAAAPNPGHSWSEVECDINMCVDSVGNKVGIGDTTPLALLTVGSGDLFQVDSLGNLVRVNNIPYSWPASQGGASTVLTNDGSGNLSWATGGGAPALSSITAATAANTIANSKYTQTWNWLLAAATADAFTFGETTASTGGSGDQSILKSTTLAGSTAIPLMVTNLGSGLSFRVNDATGDTDTTPFVVDASGNVGIGTTSPASKLDVRGSFFAGTSAVNSAGISITDTTIKPANVPGGLDLIFSDIHIDSLYSAFGGNVILAESGGNVGIGTTTPQSVLHVPDGKYAQFEDNNAGAPPAADCDADAERGRLSIDTSNNRLYICNGATRGWDYIVLTD